MEEIHEVPADGLGVLHLRALQFVPPVVVVVLLVSVGV